MTTAGPTLEQLAAKVAAGGQPTPDEERWLLDHLLRTHETIGRLLGALDVRLDHTQHH